MNGEPDLELYTFTILKLNNAFQKIESDKSEALQMIAECSDDFEELYNDILNDLEQEEIHIGDYYLFFENGKTTFPMYIESLTALNIENESIDKLINTFTNLNKIAQAFKRD